jgi:hypothetical protein
VVGTTGTGKSSLLNAMIDEYNVLPTSGTQACTAVVVKIQNNYKNDLYEADIEFLSTEVICIKQFKKGKWLNSKYRLDFPVPVVPTTPTVRLGMEHLPSSSFNCFLNK